MLKDDFDISIPISLYNELLVCWNNNNMDKVEPPWKDFYESGDEYYKNSYLDNVITDRER